MGSLDTGSILAISPNPPRQAPSAKLPFYDLKVHELESSATGPSSCPKFHHEKCQDFLIDSSPSAIVQGFATFVSAVTDLQEFSFTTITQQQEYVTVATGPAIDKPRTFSSKDTTVSLHEVSAHGRIDGNESDFELRIPTVPPARFAAEDQKQRPLILSVERTGSSNGTSTATLTLSFNLQYGPPTVAEHLLDLAALYLSPSNEEKDERPIPKSQWSCINASPQLRPPMIKPDAEARRAAGQHAGHSALLHSAFERRAAESPEAIAIEAIVDNEYNVKKWTYGELNAQADALAHELSLAQSELPGWVPAYKNQRAVALFLPGSPEFYIGVCGILKAGLAYCPLPMDAPPQRLLDIAHDSQTAVVLGLGSTPFPGVDLSDDTLETTKALKALLWVDVSDISGWRAGRSSGCLLNGNSAPTQRRSPAEDDLAYILYTSGSTGKPKGVLISHLMATCAVEGNAAACAPMPEYQGLRWLQFGLPTFDMATLEIFLTLSHGGTLCSADRQLTLSNIERVISFFKATGLFTVPSLATVLRPQDLPTLTHIICAGEALTRHVINNFSYDCAQKDGVQTKKLINIYGPSEAAMGITGEVPRAGSRGSIAGEPFACASVFLVDVNVTGELKQVPLGLTGEIVVGGPMVGYGYLNRPVETAKAFGSDPAFGSIYRTGDRGRVVWDVDGTPKMEILGRFNMEQVKLNTRRVELGDIESTIATVDAIREIAVVVVNGIFLVAYLVLHDNSAHVGDNEAVIQAARSTAEAGLPAWMRPAEYVVVPKLPRSFGGKVDRKSLQNIALEQFGASIAQPESAAAGGSDVADDVPVDLTNLQSIQVKLLSTYKRVTGDLAEDLDPSAPLTTAGLDSLRTMKFLQELRKSGVGWLAYRDIMAGNSLNGLAQLVFNASQAEAAELAAAQQEDSDEIVQIEDEEELLTLPLAVKLKHFAALTRPQCVEALAIPSEDIVDVLPATGLQTRMWVNFEECRDLGVNKPWVEHFAFTVPAHIDGDRLEEAVIKSMELRDAFRTVWVQVEHPLSPFAQCILREGSSHAALPVVRVKISAYSERPRSAWQQAIRSAQETAEDIFGLHKLPSVTTFITSEDGKHRVVILSLLHLIYDGISLELLRNNIAEAYHGVAFTGVSDKGVLVPVEEHFSSDWLGNSMPATGFSTRPALTLSP
ncbi:hypothetical protein NQ176_g7089 [Zarea fungicola]|uniref:Uncharacterized protein n=1 Tax=Zarea fungicola TaxID=93591 RepID=A0ACC1N238_9HYPO|nr:hypothetical protein NQ176_g7089 [Lecanicillium fungicola]